ncbi:MAG: lactonase family protein, partial [Bdellovibrionales bacterium]|nr:lactonase family protein [Bdellovibrionales bacterium]
VERAPSKIMTVTSSSPAYAHVFEVDRLSKKAIFKSKVAVGDYANFGGISANRKWAFTVNMGPSTMSVINVQDPENISVASTFNLASVPRVMTAHPSLSKVYYSDNSNPGTIYTLDQNPSTGALTQQGSGIPVTSRVRGMQITPSGKFMYVANWYSAEISIFTIDQMTGALSLQSTIPTCSGSVSFATNPAGTFLYVACSWSYEIGVYAIDQTSGALSAIAGSPFAGSIDNLYLSVSPDGKYLVSSSGWGGNYFTVHNINPSTGGISGATVGALTGPSTASVFSPLGDFAYFSVWNSNGDLVGYDWGSSGLGAQISISLPGTLTDLNHLVIW